MTLSESDNGTRRLPCPARFRRRGIKRAITAISRIQRLTGDDDCSQEWGELLDLLAFRRFIYRVMIEGPQDGWLTGVIVVEIVLSSTLDRECASDLEEIATNIGYSEHFELRVFCGSPDSVSLKTGPTDEGCIT